MLRIRRKFLSDSIFYGAAQAILGLRDLLILPVFAHLVGAEGYGIFTQLLVTIMLLTSVASFRLETACVRFLSSEEDPVRFRKRFYTGLGWSLGGGIIVSLLLIIFAEISAQLLFGNSSYSSFMTIGGLLLIVSIASDYLQNYLRIIERIASLAAILLTQSILEIVLIILVLNFDYGLSSAIWALFAVRLILGICLFVFIQHHLGSFTVAWAELRPMLSYSLPLMPNTFTYWAINYADRIIIIQFLGIAAVGIYSASYSLGQSLSLLSSPIGFVIFPLLSRLWDEQEQDEVNKYLIYVTRYYFFLALPICVGLAWLSQPLFHIIATVEFAADTMLVFWIALGIVLKGLFQFNVYIFHLVKKTKYVTLILFLGSFLNVGLNIFLVPIIGLSGAALATAITFLLLASVAIFYGQRMMAYTIKWLDVGKSAVASGVMAFCLYWVPINTFGSMLAVVFLGGLIYLALLITLRTFSKTELAQIRRLIFSY